jgi:hypothetical protein
MRYSVLELLENVPLVCDAEMACSFDYYSLPNSVTINDVC